MSERTQTRRDAPVRHLVGPVTGGFVGLVIGVFAGLGFGGLASYVVSIGGFGDLLGTVGYCMACAGVGGAAVGAGARPRTMLTAVGVVAAIGTLFGIAAAGPRALVTMLLMAGAIAVMAYVAGERGRRAGR